MRQRANRGAFYSRSGSNTRDGHENTGIPKSIARNDLRNTGGFALIGCRVWHGTCYCSRGGLWKSMMTGSGTKTRRLCSFRLADVLCPEPRQVLVHLTPELEVSGEVVFMSDQGQQPDRFAIVNVEGILSPLIVPTERLRGEEHPEARGY